MAPVACNTNPLFIVPLTPDPQKGPDLGSPYTSCSGGAVLPTHSHCSALLCRVERGSSEPACSRHPSNVSYAGSSSVPPKGQVSI